MTTFLVSAVAGPKRYAGGSAFDSSTLVYIMGSAIGTGCYGTIGHGRGTRSGYSIGGGRGGERGHWRPWLGKA